MIVQHTDKECKTKFSIGVEFKNSLYVKSTKTKKYFSFKKKYCIIQKAEFNQSIQTNFPKIDQNE